MQFATPSPATTGSLKDDADPNKLQQHSGPGAQSTDTGTTSSSGGGKGKGIKSGSRTIATLRTSPPLVPLTKVGPTQEPAKSQRLQPKMPPPLKLVKADRAQLRPKSDGFSKQSKLVKGTSSIRGVGPKAIQPSPPQPTSIRPLQQQQPSLPAPITKSIALKNGKTPRKMIIPKTALNPFNDQLSTAAAGTGGGGKISPVQSLRASLWGDVTEVLIRSTKNTAGYEKQYATRSVSVAATNSIMAKTPVPLSEAPPLEEDDSEKLIVISKFSERQGGRSKKKRRRRRILICSRTRKDEKGDSKRRVWIIVGISLVAFFLVLLFIGLGIYALIRAQNGSSSGGVQATTTTTISAIY